MASPSGTSCPVSLTVPHFLLSSASFPLAPADSVSSRGLGTRFCATFAPQISFSSATIALRNSWAYQALGLGPRVVQNYVGLTEVMNWKRMTKMAKSKIDSFNQKKSYEISREELIMLPRRMKVKEGET